MISRLASASMMAALLLLSGSRSVTVTLRAKPQSVVVYEPARPRPNAVDVLVLSGDVGWTGLPVTIAEHLQSQGFRVIGFNARAYLASFTGGPSQLKDQDVPRDFESVLQSPLWSRPDSGVVVVGVSEGAGLGALALGQFDCGRCRGLVALGLPQKTSLGWRWTDFTMWITKSDPNEPMADTKNYLPHLKLPLLMIHSTHDEWDPIESARSMYQLAPQPKRMVEIDASNHRFSNKIPDVLNEIDRAVK